MTFYIYSISHEDCDRHSNEPRSHMVHLFVHLLRHLHQCICLLQPSSQYPARRLSRPDIDAPVIVEATIYDYKRNVSDVMGRLWVIMKARVDRVIKGPSMLAH